jgi:hypothetical protein
MNINLNIQSENDDVSVVFNQNKEDENHNVVWISILDASGNERFDAPYSLTDLVKVVQALTL